MKCIKLTISSLVLSFYGCYFADSFFYSCSDGCSEPKKSPEISLEAQKVDVEFQMYRSSLIPSKIYTWVGFLENYKRFKLKTTDSISLTVDRVHFFNYHNSDVAYVLEIDTMKVDDFVWNQIYVQDTSEKIKFSKHIQFPAAEKEWIVDSIGPLNFQVTTPKTQWNNMFNAYVKVECRSVESPSWTYEWKWDTIAVELNHFQVQLSSEIIDNIRDTYLARGDCVIYFDLNAVNYSVDTLTPFKSVTVRKSWFRRWPIKYTPEF